MMSKTFLSLLIFLFVFGESVNAQKSESLKIISYNIWNGFDWGKDEDRRSELVSWVKEQKPTIVGLQELCKYSDKKLKEDAKSWNHNYSVLLKKSGYSVGLTSEFPIEVIEKIRGGMHHGALHCRTAGIDIFVVHFSPASYKKRREETKIILQKLKEVAKSNSKYLVMGDFNAHSPFDADLYKNEVLLNRYRKSNADKPETGNLVDNEFDYSVLSNFLAFPLIDACQKFTNGIAERGSFPGRVFAKMNQETEDQLINRLERIDYILLSPELAKNSSDAKVGNTKENWYLSDHYPVIAEIKIR